MNKIIESKIIYVFYALISGTLLGSVGILATIKSDFDMSSSTIFFWRFFLASLLFLPSILKSSSVDIDRKHIVYLIITSVILYGPAIFFYFSKISNNNTVLAVILYGITFILASLLARLISKGNVSIRTFLELLILCFGLYFIYANNSTQNILILIIGTILYAAAIFTNKIYTKTLHTKYSAFATCLGTSLFFLGMSLLNKTFIFPDSKNLIYLALLGVICTAIPIWLITRSLSKLSALQLSALIIIEPIFSAFLNAGGISNNANLKQSIATAAILLTMLIHKNYFKKNSN